MRQRVNKWFILGILVLLILPLAGGCKKGPSLQETGTGSIGILNLDKVMRAHPRYNELEKIDQQIARQTADAARVPSLSEPVKQGTQTRGIAEQELSGYQQATAQLVDAKMSDKQKELARTLDAQVSAERAGIMRQVAEYSREIEKEYQPAILSLQLKLQTVQLTPEERERIQAQISAEQRARDEKIRVKETELEQAIRPRLEQMQKDAEVQLTRYHQQLLSEASAQLDSKRKEMENRMSGSIQNAQANSSQPADLKILQEQREKLYEIIIKELKDSAAKIATQRKLEVVLIRYQQNIQAIDITDEVIAGIKR